MPRVPFHSNFWALARLYCQVGVYSRISNRNPEHIAGLGFIKVFNHTSHHFAELRSNWNFLRKPPSHAPSSFPFHSLTTSPSRLSSQGPSGNYQLETLSHCRARIQIRNFPGNHHGPFLAHTQLSPKKFSIMCTQPHYCFKPYHITSPSTYPSYHPYQSPTITPSTRPLLINLTYGLY